MTHVGNPEVLRHACFILSRHMRGITDMYKQGSSPEHCSSVSHLLYLVFDLVPNSLPMCPIQLKDAKKLPRRKSSVDAFSTTVAATAAEQSLPKPKPSKKKQQQQFSSFSFLISCLLQRQTLVKTVKSMLKTLQAK